MERLLFDILFFVSLFIIPPWLAIPVLFVAIVFFPRYVEAVFAGAIIDSISTSNAFFGVGWFFTLVLLLSLVLIELVRGKMR